MTKSRARRGGSKLGRPTSFMSAKRLLREGVQLACLNVGLKLTIPKLRIEIGIPTPELSQFLRRQLADLLLQVLDFAHYAPRYLAEVYARR